MNDGLFSAEQRLERGVNQVFACLDQNLQPNIIGSATLLDQAPVERELCIRGGRKANLDFFETAFDERLEEFELLANVHRNGQRLVAIAQIHAAPDWRSREHATGPLAVGQI